jgi:hypothetical protein
MWQTMERGEDCFRIFTPFFATADGAEEWEDER